MEERIQIHAVCRNPPRISLTLTQKSAKMSIHLPVWWNGRHQGLKIPCRQLRTGSSPVTGTKKAPLHGVLFCVSPYRDENRRFEHEDLNRSSGDFPQESRAMPKSEVSRRREPARVFRSPALKKHPYMGCFFAWYCAIFWQLPIAMGWGAWYNNHKTAKGGICCEKQVF